MTAAPGAAAWNGTFTVKGTAVIGDKKIEVEGARRCDVECRPATANVPTVARLSRSLALAVRDGAPFQLAAKADKTEVPVGDK